MDVQLPVNLFGVLGEFRKPSGRGRTLVSGGVENRRGVLWSMYRAQLTQVLNIDAGRRLAWKMCLILHVNEQLVGLPQFDSQCLAYFLGGWGPSQAFEPE